MRPTLALVRDAVEVEELEPLELKGKAEPGPAYRLLHVRETPERRHESAFVGRSASSSAPPQAWERARAERAASS